MQYQQPPNDGLKLHGLYFAGNAPVQQIDADPFIPRRTRPIRPVLTWSGIIDAIARQTQPSVGRIERELGRTRIGGGCPMAQGE
jgi:hypothetical protein